MGGYIAFPGGMMASLLNRPLAIHEQNSIAGLTNKVLAKLADRVLVAFPGALPAATFTCNPVRTQIAHVAAPAMRYRMRTGPLRVLVVGGSLGAAALNEIVPKALAAMPADRRPRVTHQAGEKHIETLRVNYAQAGVAGECVAFIDDMAAAYANADLVVCRAGATTVAELAAAGVASLLVPFPFAVDDHQTTNAKYLADPGAALLVQQRELAPERLADILLGLDRPRLEAMAEKAHALAKPEATAAVADICEALAK
jgi:UDP-N-acetylglucosamine--N-acetylmuramyl-(pentapeptide) pyrophosphoryl-undecaprenol N-acetylglucosamine transferase